MFKRISVVFEKDIRDAINDEQHFTDSHAFQAARALAGCFVIAASAEELLYVGEKLGYKYLCSISSEMEKLNEAMEKAHRIGISISFASVRLNGDLFYPSIIAGINFFCKEGKKPFAGAIASFDERTGENTKFFMRHPKWFK